MREGRIVQSGSPRELYDKPVNRYVADFVGKSNFFAGPSENTVISVRPEFVEIAADEKVLPEGLSTHIPVKILNRIFLGENTEYRVASDMLGEFMVLSPRKSERTSGIFEIGDSAVAGWRPEAALVLAAT
jgi:spermidine/putrescine transport system ATP-binding protein